MHIHGPCSSPAESQSLEVESRHLCFNKPSRYFWCLLRTTAVRTAAARVSLPIYSCWAQQSLPFPLQPTDLSPPRLGPRGCWEVLLVQNRTCQYHHQTHLNKCNPCISHDIFCFVGMRKTIHFLEQRTSAKSQAELGLMFQGIECPSELGWEDVRARVGLFGYVGKQIPTPQTSSSCICDCEPRQKVGECSALSPSPKKMQFLYFLWLAWCPCEPTIISCTPSLPSG